MKNNLTAAQKVTAFVCGLLICASTLKANTYYFSASQGDDNRTTAQAQNATTPWKSIEKLNAIFSQLNPGDSILFRSGESFYGSININKSGTTGSPIVFSSYGIGEKPEITGFVRPTSWSRAGNNIWETVLSATPQRVNNVLADGLSRAAGRYPNADASNKGYLTIESAQGTSSISAGSLTGTHNWTGGEVVIRKARWVIDRNVITQHQGNTINYTSQSGYGAGSGFGYFIQNHPKTLDKAGEWYYQSSGSKFGIYSSGIPATGSVAVSTIGNLVSISNQSNIRFSNLQFTGANDNALLLKNANNITLTNCDLLYGYNGITAWSSDFVTIENCTISHSNNNACHMEGCNNIVLRKNTITNTGAFAGMGDGDSGSYEGLMVSGNNQLIESNTIDSTGYIAITFRGNNVVVKNNVITNFSFVKDDGSGIYTWNNVSNPPNYTGEVISNNIILNGLGAGEGTPDPQNRYANGIYMDDNAGGVEISGNTVANCSNHGFYIHNAHDLVIKNNLVYNNATQLEMTHDDIAPYPIRNVTMAGNSFVSRTKSQHVAAFKTNENDISSFGNFDNNYYSRPFFDDQQIGVLTRVNGNYKWEDYNVESWKRAYGKDVNSKASPVTYLPFTINSNIGSNLVANGNFSNDIQSLWMTSDANNASISLAKDALDGGALQVSFSSNTGNSNAMVMMVTGSLVAGHQYALKFSMKGTNADKKMNVYLRQGQDSYADLGDHEYFSTNNSRQEYQFLFKPSSSIQRSNVVFIIPDAAGTVYLDNIDLTEVNVSEPNYDDSIRFVYNGSASGKSFQLSGNYVDLGNNDQAASVNLPAYGSSILLKKKTNQPSISIPPTVACSATGSILRELWNNIGGNNVSDIPLQTPPTSSSQINIFESPSDFADSYGTRIRGFICPPQTGNYTFWIAGDDATELWLSTDSTTTNKVKIAYNLSWTNPREWNKFASQKSASIYLQAGHKYYIEALHKEGGGGDNLAVAWQLPNGAMEAPIPGSRLSPVSVSTVVKSSQTISFDPIDAKIYGDAPFTLNASASSGLAVSFSVVSGPATISGNTVTLTGTGNVMIQASQNGNAAYEAATPVNRSFAVNAQTSTATCTATGTILREQWNNIGGHAISSIPLQSIPNLTSNLTLFESPTNTADSYGTRIRGFICPPQTGNYTFWIAGDDATELWLSTDSTTANKVKIAYNLSWTNPREWDRFASQKSASIYLQAGHKYYIEALHKEGDGGDNLAVAWQLPNGTMEAPIPGSRLSPAVATVATTTPGTSCSGAGSIVREQWNNIGGNSTSSIPLQKNPESVTTLTMFESPSNMADNYGARFRGYICPPLSGNYTFWVAADDEAQLWLSNSADPAGKKMIANVYSYTGEREWNKYSSQKSVSIYLEANQLYYVEALHKEGGGGDNFAVAWQLPNGTMEAPMPGIRLIPYYGNSAASNSYMQGDFSTNTAIGLFDKSGILETSTLSVYPNPLITTATVEVNVKDANSSKLDLLDEQGRIVKHLFSNVEANKINRFTLSSSNLQNGLYIIRLVTPTETITRKIIVGKYH